MARRKETNFWIKKNQERKREIRNCQIHGHRERERMRKTQTKKHLFMN